MAARLAPNLKSLSTKDALRPLLIKGFHELSEIGERENEDISLNHCYLAVLLASVKAKVRLYPEMSENEPNYFKHEETIKTWIDGGYNNKRIIKNFPTDSKPPVSLLYGIYDVLFANYYGIEDLALASVIELPYRNQDLKQLPNLLGIVEAEEQKIALVRAWIKEWTKNMIWMGICPDDWKQDSNEKYNKYIKSHKGKFSRFENIVLRKSKNSFNKNWLPKLLNDFCEQCADGKYRFKGSEVTLNCTGEWAYCNICKTTQRPFPDKNICIHCGKNTSKKINPNEDSVFSARRKYYRKPTTDFLEKNEPPISLITAEHTAQLNSAQLEQNFSKAEEYELLFQDINLDAKENLGRPAIDVLSCTTTMEVGIDIGSLSGVALRNMPPSRASYQQRSGRAGRRANAIATVIGYASTDSHDEHYFKSPEQMIKGKAKDPFLNLDNISITERHIRAYLLQRYYRERCRDISPNEQDHQNLFSVLGTVDDFRSDNSLLNFKDLEKWIKENHIALKKEISNWIPREIKDIELDLEKIVSPIKDAIRVDEE